MFYKDTVSVYEVLVPEEQIVFERVLNGSNQSLVLALLTLDHRVVH